MEREIKVEAVYRKEPDIRSGVLALLAYAKQMQEAEAIESHPDQGVSEPQEEGSDG